MLLVVNLEQLISPNNFKQQDIIILIGNLVLSPVIGPTVEESRRYSNTKTEYYLIKALFIQLFSLLSQHNIWMQLFIFY